MDPKGLGLHWKINGKLYFGCSRLKLLSHKAIASITSETKILDGLYLLRLGQYIINHD